MGLNLGTKSVFDFFKEESNYSSVAFFPGAPALSSELNLAQELNTSLMRKGLSSFKSGWVSKYPLAFIEGTQEKDCFYTQSPEVPKPEIALVNGWPIHVQFTNTEVSNLNKILLAADDYRLTSGARADGVYLEVWRGLVSNDAEGKTTPPRSAVVPKINSVFHISPKKAFAVGEEGTVLRFNGAGVWETVVAPTSVELKGIAFDESGSFGVAVGVAGEMLKSEDGGITWIRVRSGVSATLNSVVVSSSVNSFRVIAVGNDGAIIESEDSGITFTSRVVQGYSTDLTSISLIPGTNGQHSVVCGKKGLIAKRESPTTSNWIQSKSLSSYDLVSVVMASGVEGYACGEKGTVLKSVDGGSTWSVIQYETGFSGNDLSLTSMAISDPGRVRLSVRLSDVASSMYIGFSYEVTSDEIIFRLNPVSPLVSGDNKKVVTLRHLSGKSKNVSELIDEVHSFLISGGRLFNASLDTDSVLQVSGLVSEKNTAKLGMSIGSNVYFFGYQGVSPTVLTLNETGLNLVLSDWTASLTEAGMSQIVCSDSIGDDFITVAGDSGIIFSIDTSAETPVWEMGITDVYTKVVHRVYKGGNFNAPITISESADYIHPEIGMETSGRVQVQYAIRIAPGIDIENYPESGLGSGAIAAMGPNKTPIGSAFESMSDENGDSSLYKAVCPGTVDGFSYAIPMFIIHRRNESAFDPVSNINGSSVEGVSLSPDGKYSWQITEKDVTDVRRSIITSSEEVKDSSFNKVLRGELGTSVKFSEAAGSQYGVDHLIVDRLPASSLPVSSNSNLVNSEEVLLGAFDSTTFDWVTVKEIAGKAAFIDPTYASRFRFGLKTETGIKPGPLIIRGLGSKKIDLNRADSLNFTLRVSNPTTVFSGRCQAVLLDSSSQIVTDTVLIQSGTKLSIVLDTGTTDVVIPVTLANTAVFERGIAELSTIASLTNDIYGLIDDLAAVDLQFDSISEEDLALEVAVKVSWVTAETSGLPLSRIPSKPLSVKLFQPGSAISTQEYFLGVTSSQLMKDLILVKNSLGISKVFYDGRQGAKVLADLLVVSKTDLSLTSKGLSAVYLEVDKNLEGFSILGVKEVVSVDGLISYPIKYVETGYTYSDGRKELSKLRIVFSSGYNPPADTSVLVKAESFNSSYGSFYIGSSTDIGKSNLDTFRSANLAVFAPGSRGLASLQRSVIKASSTLSTPSDLTSYATMRTLNGEISFVWAEMEPSYFRSIDCVIESGVITPVEALGSTPLSYLIPGYQVLDTTALSSLQAEVSYLSKAKQTVRLGSGAEVEILSSVSGAVASSSGGLSIGSESSIDYLESFHALIPQDAFTRSDEFTYTYSGMKIPNSLDRTHTRQLSTVSQAVPSRFTVIGETQVSGDFVYISLDKDLAVKLDESLELGNRKVAAPLLVRVIKGPKYLEGEILLAVVSRAVRNTKANELYISNASSSTFGGASIAFYRVPGLPSPR